MLAHLIPLAAVLCGAAAAARAACVLQLDGDPEVIAPLRQAIDAFRDDGASCVDVRALCSRDGTDVVIDLRDELGRTVQRRFATPEGAAAFLISWSRRPLPQSGTGLEPDRQPGMPLPAGTPPTDAAPRGASRPGLLPRDATPPDGSSRGSAPPGLTQPGATPPRSAPPDAPPSGARFGIALGIPDLTFSGSVPTAGEVAQSRSASTPGVHSEVRAAYISAPLGAPNIDGLAGMVDFTFLLHGGTLRYGLGVRGIAASVSQRDSQGATEGLSWIEADAEAMLGTRWRLKRVELGADVFAGFGLASSVTQSPVLVDVRGVGARGGARLVVASELGSTVWLEARMAWDGLRQLGLPGESDDVLRSDRYLGQAHLEIGLLWVP